MDIKARLREYGRLEDKIEQVTRDINACKAEKRGYYDLKCSIISDMPRGTETSNPTLKAVELLIDGVNARLEDLMTQLNTYKSIQAQISKALLVLTDQERRIIELRYTDGVPFRGMFGRVDVSPMTCVRLHNGALCKILKALDV